MPSCRLPQEKRLGPSEPTLRSLTLAAKPGFAALVLGAFLCTPLPAAPPGEITLRITRAFDREPIVQRSLPPTGNVIDVLRQATPIDASPAGFVSAIGDLRSGAAQGRNEEWFLFVNGVLAPVGAAQYRPAAGDHIWWDFHPWSDAFQFGAAIGAFPEPFAHGYGGKAVPTRIYFTAGFEAEADHVTRLLQESGVTSISKTLLVATDRIDVEKGAPLLIGRWDMLAAHPTVADIHRHAAKTGLLVEFSPRGAAGRDWHGTAGLPSPAAGAILAAKTGARRGACLWLVTGTGDAETREAVDAIVREPGSIIGSGGLLIVNGSRISLPLPVPTTDPTP